MSPDRPYERPGLGWRRGAGRGTARLGGPEVNLLVRHTLTSWRYAPPRGSARSRQLDHIADTSASEARGCGDNRSRGRREGSRRAWVGCGVVGDGHPAVAGRRPSSEGQAGPVRREARTSTTTRTHLPKRGRWRRGGDDGGGAAAATE